MNYKKTNPIFPIFFLILLLYFLAMNTISPIQSDDFIFLYSGKNPLNVLHHTLSATKHLYFTWSGRVYTWITEYFLFWSPTAVNIANSIAACLFFYGVFLNIKLRNPRSLIDIFTLLFIFSIVYLFTCGYAEVFYWKNAGFYLRGIACTLLLTYPYLQLLKNKDVISGHPIKVIAIIIAAVILGTAVENLSAAVSLFFIMVSIIYWRRNKTLPWAVSAVTIAYLVGTAILIAAPGNYARAQVIHHASSGPAISLKTKLWFFTTRLISHFDSSNYGSLPLVILAIIAVIVAIILLFHRHKIDKQQVAAFLFLSLFSAFALLAAPGIILYNRTIFFSDLFFIMATFSVISELSSIRYWQIIYATTSLILFVCLLPGLKKEFTTERYIHAQLRQRDLLIHLFQENKTETPYMQAIYIPALNINSYEKGLIYTSHLIFSDISHGPENRNWITAEFQNYYDLDKVNLRPFVQIWSELTAGIDLTKSKNSFNIVKHSIFFHVNTQGSCDAIPDKSKFYLDIYPKNLKDLPIAYRQQGFEHMTFDWGDNHQVIVLSDQGKIKQDVCVLATVLPEYNIAAIKTGQYPIAQLHH